MKNTKIVKGIGSDLCGYEDREDRWLRHLSFVVDRACNLFWTRTPEREKIQREFLAKRYGY
jgi:hypothetical protein